MFGYDVEELFIGRGVIEALGAGLSLSPSDLAVRGNFVTVNEKGEILDRRAGRLPDSVGEKLVDLLREKLSMVEDVVVEYAHLKEYRFAMVLRGEGLSPLVEETDPQKTGLSPLFPRPLSSSAEKSSRILAFLQEESRKVLQFPDVQYGVVFRGYGFLPTLPTYKELFGMNCAVVAHYPLYRGVGRLIGFDMIPVSGKGEALKEKIEAVCTIFPRYDLVFLHIKKTDSFGEDGNLEEKVKLIEEVDRTLPTLLSLKPDVVVITGDHSTPVRMRSHSWHPVPVLLYGRYLPFCPARRFTERECLRGALGRFPSRELIGEVLAQAGRLKKFGA